MLRDAIIRSADTASASRHAEFAAASSTPGTAPAAPPASRRRQSELFPDLPARLYVRPGVLRPVALMDGHDWDMAYNMLHTRAQRDRAAEADLARVRRRLSGKVRPLLTPADLTTADVLGDLEDGAAAAP